MDLHTEVGEKEFFFEPLKVRFHLCVRVQSVEDDSEEWNKRTSEMFFPSLSGLGVNEKVLLPVLGFAHAFWSQKGTQVENTRGSGAVKDAVKERETCNAAALREG